MTRDLKGYKGNGRAIFTKAKAEMIDAGLSDLEGYLRDHANNWPLCHPVLSFDDLVESLPIQMQRTRGIRAALVKALKQRFGFESRGQVRVGKDKPSLWVKSESGLTKIKGADVGATYARLRAEHLKGATAAKPIAPELVEDDENTF